MELTLFTTVLNAHIKSIKTYWITMHKTEYILF